MKCADVGNDDHEAEAPVIFHANSAAIGGRIAKPKDIVIETTAASSLTAAGGRFRRKPLVLRIRGILGALAVTMMNMVSKRALSYTVIICCTVVIAFGTPTLSGQTSSAVSKAPAYAPPRTPDGKPDLQGTWTNGTLTPFERPVALANKPFLTEEEAAETERQAAARRANPVRRPGDVGSDNEAFVDTGYKVTPTRQTSLVTDPPDGRVVILPAAEARRDFNLRNLDSYETMSPWDRCITRGPTNLFPAGYNNGYQIIQTPTHVVILSEMIHEARIIPTDGSPHASQRVRSWSGDSRGRWEGPTLVVDTTNFHDRGWITTHAASGRLRGTPHTEALHIVERFTRVSADMLSYTMTIEDPAIYEKPWTVSIPFMRDDGYRIFEYACHEGNQATGLMLRGARVQEQDAIDR